MLVLVFIESWRMFMTLVLITVLLSSIGCCDSFPLLHEHQHHQQQRQQQQHPLISAFQRRPLCQRHPQPVLAAASTASDENAVQYRHPTPQSLQMPLVLMNRRSLVHKTLATLTAAAAAVTLGNSCANVARAAENDGSPTSTTAVVEEGGIPVLKTASGLKYIDLIPGTGPSPAYGNLVSIAYTAYIKLPPNSKKYQTEPQQYDKVDRYLLKHGNGRTIAGLDEGLHTMRVGGKRRMLIPPKLGFVDVGLGPLPVGPFERYKLNALLDQMVELSGGTVVYEVTLLNVIRDEADQGYYADASLTPEDFATLRENLRVKGNAGRIEQRAAEAAAATASTGQDRVR